MPKVMPRDVVAMAPSAVTATLEVYATVLKECSMLQCFSRSDTAANANANSDAPREFASEFSGCQI